jgi:hypothetical protein
VSPPNEPMSQRQLALELRFQIDHARKHPKDAAQSKHRVLQLVETHPRGMASRHVQHNLGEARNLWLRDLLGSAGRQEADRLNADAQMDLSR